MSKKYEPKFLINEAMIQEEAENCLNRELTSEEINQVFEGICDEWMSFVQERILWVMDFNEILKRNVDADKERIHFDAYHRNKNAFEAEFTLMHSFKNEAEAHEYLSHFVFTEFDEWKICRVEGEKVEQVWSINVKP